MNLSRKSIRRTIYFGRAGDHVERLAARIKMSSESTDNEHTLGFWRLHCGRALESRSDAYALKKTPRMGGYFDTR
jgi:hypothetical protein